jgi:hypothetical protein
MFVAAEWIQGPAVLESDCCTVIKYLTNPRLQRARTIFTIQEATKAAAQLPRAIFKHIRREQRIRIRHPWTKARLVWTY